MRKDFNVQDNFTFKETVPLKVPQNKVPNVSKKARSFMSGIATEPKCITSKLDSKSFLSKITWKPPNTFARQKSIQQMNINISVCSTENKTQDRQAWMSRYLDWNQSRQVCQDPDRHQAPNTIHIQKKAGSREQSLNSYTHERTILHRTLSLNQQPYQPKWQDLSWCSVECSKSLTTRFYFS